MYDNIKTLENTVNVLGIGRQVTQTLWVSGGSDRQSARVRVWGGENHYQNALAEIRSIQIPD